MNQADHDGTAPVHVASANRHLEVVQFLCEQGIDMQRRGSIFDYALPEGRQLLTDMTPLMIAKHYQRLGGDTGSVVVFLEA